jgi:hypothetical protein
MEIEPPQLDEAERQKLPDWLREPITPEEKPAPVVGAAQTTGELDLAAPRPEDVQQREEVESAPVISDAETPAEPAAVEEAISPVTERPAWFEELKPLQPILAEQGISQDDTAPWDVPEGRKDKPPAPAVVADPFAEVTELSGPLAGIRGVIPLAHAITQSHMRVAPSISRNDGARVFESVLATSREALEPQADTAIPTIEVAAPRRVTLNHIIYVLIFLAALIPFFLPADWSGLGLSVTSPTTAAFYDKVQSVAPGSTVLLAFDYTAGQGVELNPAAQIVTRDLARRGVNVIALSTSPSGAQIAQTVLRDTAQQIPNWQNGKNFLNVGYIPGAEAGLRKLSDQWLAPNQTDFDQHSLAASPLATALKSLRDVALVIELAGSDESLRWWMEQAQPSHQTTFVAVVSAAVEAQARNYSNSKQLAAFLRGLTGAAEYELSLNQPGQTVRTVDAQSFAHVVIFAIIIVGNIAFWLSRIRKRRGDTTS